MTPEKLLALTEANTAFSRDIPGLQIAWDSTSLGLLKTCPRKYYLAMIEGWEPKGKAIALDFGIWYHQGLEHYHKFKARGMDHEAALRHVVHCLLELSGTLDENFQFVPWEPSDTKRNRFTLVRAVVWYLEEFGEGDAAETVHGKDGKPMVELSFRFETHYNTPEMNEHAENAGNPYLLCGHFDRIAEFAGQKFVSDYKTTGSTISSRFFDGFTPDNQMSLYTFAGGVVLGEPVAGVIIDGAQVAVTFNRFGRGFAPRTPEQTQEWYDDLGRWFNLAEDCASAMSWPMNDTAGACGMYGGCTFRNICAKSPSVRHVFLEGDFARRVWNPLIPRD